MVHAPSPPPLAPRGCTPPPPHPPHAPALQSLASQLFAASLFPYLAFLFFLTRSGQAPRLMLGGFYFLLAFVGATIPAGIYGEAARGLRPQRQQRYQAAQRGMRSAA